MNRGQGSRKAKIASPSMPRARGSQGFLQVYAHLLGTTVFSTVFAAAASGAAAQAPEVETIIVTGSRIQNLGFNSPTPVTVLSGQQIDAYRLPTDSLELPGTLEFRSLTTYVRHFERTDRTGTTFTTVDYAGSSRLGGSPKWSGTVVVNNLLGADPPSISIAALAGNGGGNPYDFVGRNFKVGVRFEW